MLGFHTVVENVPSNEVYFTQASINLQFERLSDNANGFL